MDIMLNKKITRSLNAYTTSGDIGVLARLAAWFDDNYNQCSAIEKNVCLILCLIGAQKNNPICLFHCGTILALENRNAGIHLVEQAADLNCGAAQKYLANTYYFSDSNKAIYYFQQYLQAENSDKGEAYEALGRLYYDVDAPDYKKGFEYFSIAADTYNRPYAKYRIASAYFYGEGIEANHEKAFQYCLEAANLGCAEAQYWLGKDYYIANEFELVQDLSKAKHYLLLAHKQNYPRSALFLGIMYYSGEGVEKDYKIAEKYLKEAKEAEMWTACAFLGQIYFEQGKYFLARVELEKSFFENENTINGSTLAQIYKEGLQCEPDAGKATKCYEILIQNKEASEDDICYVADNYYIGNGVPKDFERAAYYYNLVEYSNAYAKYRLGCIALEPASNINSNRCILYFESAGAKGYTVAYQKLGDYFQSVNNLDKALEYYIKCYKLGDGESAYKVGKIYETGTTSKSRNLNEAVNWYMKAADQGYTKASEELNHFKSTLFGYKRIN